MPESINKNKFVELAKKCKTDTQKIDFFDTYPVAFMSTTNRTSLIKENIPKEIDDAFYVYANMKRMTDDELNKLRESTWENFPTNFKIFLFDFCFLNAM